MSDWTGLANMALGHLGSRAITDIIADQSPGARLIRGVYLNLADEVLYAHPWKVALQDFNLGADGTPPLFSYQYAYSFPTDPWALRAWLAGDDIDGLEGFAGGRAERWIVKGRKILTDFAPPLPATFVVRVTDPNMFVGLLGTCMSRRLAWEIAYKLTNSREKEAEAKQAYEEALESARSLDGQQGHGRRHLIQSDILDARD